MVVNIEAIIYYLVFLDSLFAVFVAFFANKWFNKKFKKLRKHAPLTRFWGLVYFLLVIWVGCALKRLGVLFY